VTLTSSEIISLRQCFNYMSIYARLRGYFNIAFSDALISFGVDCHLLALSSQSPAYFDFITCDLHFKTDYKYSDIVIAALRPFYMVIIHWLKYREIISLRQCFNGI